MKKILVNAGLLPEQLEVLKKKLEIKISEKQEEIRELLKEISEKKDSEKTGINGDRCDRAFEQVYTNVKEEDDKVKACKHFIEKCQKAIDRMSAGTYGYDFETGEPIPIDRLMSVPHTTKCLSTKEKMGSTICPYKRFA